MTVGDGVGTGTCEGVGGAGGGGEVGPGAGGAGCVTVRGVSGAGVPVPVGWPGVVLSGEVLGTPGEFDGSGECGTALGRGDGGGDVGGGRQTGSTEPWASLRIWPMASSSEPVGRPASTWALSASFRSVTRKSSQPEGA